jgi:methylglutaconyl-CoA hydratase
MTLPLLVTKQYKIATFTLNRPERCNALDGSLVKCLQQAFSDVARDNETRMVVLRANGRHFCAGADIKWMQELAQGTFEQSRDDARELASLLLQIYAFPKPIISLVQGEVLGGGIGLLACSDIVLAAENSAFCFSEAKIGLIPAIISPYIVSILGEFKARYYFLTAKKFDAHEAYRVGLVHQVMGTEELNANCQMITSAIMNNSPAALMEIKKLIPKVVNQEISLELAEKTAEIFAQIRISQQGREGVKAFIEKRPPAWKV